MVKIQSRFDLVSVAGDSTLPLTQTFETLFREAAGNKNSVKFSGNPGYIVGAPIRAGILSAEGSALTSNASFYFILFFLTPPNSNIHVIDQSLKNYFKMKQMFGIF